MGFIYLLKSDIDGYITYKIGKTSRRPKDRLNELSTGNAGILTIEHLYETKNYHKLEKVLHNHLKQYHINKEWFNDNITKELFIESCNYWDSILTNLIDMENPFI